ncbi:MAG: hypothetical protein HY816_17645 [Candidatus Wallbacteria bacterium]|nr:hypothetical protein [Candidatus Wallbacteria bacterium]
MGSRIMRGKVPFRKSRRPVAERPLTGPRDKAENPDELGGFLAEQMAPANDRQADEDSPRRSVLVPAQTRMPADLSYQMMAQAPNAPSMPELPPAPGSPQMQLQMTQPAQPAAGSPATAASTAAAQSTTKPVDLDQLITVDLRDTDIKHFIKILSEQTQTNWVFDPAMGGKINMLGPQRMSLREAQHLLTSILEFKGFTIEQIGNIRRLVPRTEGKFRNTVMRFGEYVAPEGYPLSEDKLVTQLIRLKHRNVNEVRGVLVNFAKDAAAILPYAPTNSLFITDNGTYIHRLMRIIQELDVPEQSKRVGTITLRYAFGKQILQPLNEILKQTRAPRAGQAAAPAAGAPPAPPAPPPVEGAPGAPPQPGMAASSSGAATILVNDADNELLVITYPDDFEYIEEIVRMLDRDPDHVPELKVVNLKYSDPDVVSKLVQDAFKSDPALTSSIKQFSIIPDKRTGSVLVTSYSPKMMLRVTDLIQKLDIPVLTAGSAIRVYKLEFAEAKKVAEVLGGLSTGDDEVSSSVVASGSSTGTINSQLGQPGFPGGRDQYGRFTPGTTVSSSTASGPAKKTAIIADEATNSLVIIATREKFNQLTAVIKELDVVRPQVLVEVLIVRIDVNHARALGLDFNAVETSSSKNRPFAIGSTGQLPSLFSATGVRTGLNLGLLDSGNFDISAAARGDLAQLSKIGVLIHVLANDSRANILSAPKLLTGDNQEATIKVGAQVRIPQGSTLNAINTITNFVTEDLGINLQLTPRITKNDFVTMKIKTQIKNIIPDQSVAGIPVIGNNDIETNISVENRTTIVMGGLIQEEERKSETRIPLLGDIPVLGHLFRDTQTTKVKSNLLVFMTPNIIRTSQAGKSATKRVSPVLRFVKIKERKRPDTADPSTLLKAMNEAR